MARVLLAVGVVVLAALLWWLRAETAAPAPHAGEPSVTAREPDDDRDDGDDEQATEPGHARATPPRLAAVTPAAAKPFDPWADPGPVDPSRPRLEAEPPPDLDHTMDAAFRSAMAAAVPELRRCYRSQHPRDSLELVIRVVMRTGEDGKPVISPHVHARNNAAPITPELEACLTGVVASLDLPAPDEARPVHMIEIVRLTPDPAN